MSDQLWDEVVGIPIDQWGCARSVAEIGRWVKLRDEGRIDRLYYPMPWAWRSNPHVLDRVVRALADTQGGTE